MIFTGNNQKRTAGKVNTNHTNHDLRRKRGRVECTMPVHRSLAHILKFVVFLGAREQLGVS